MRFAWLLALYVLSSACGDAGPATSVTSAVSSVDPAATATITGKVLVEGALPADQVVRLDGDAKCVALVGNDRRALGAIVPGDEGTLQNVFVYVKDTLSGAQFPVPTGPVPIEQQKCEYVPRVLGLRVGQALAIRNGDPLMHNIRSEAAINQPFDMSQPVAGVTTERRFATREVMVPLKCNVHAWMRAYIGVLEHPFFAVTGQAGTFSIAALPPGTYTLEAWHETLGTQSVMVTVAAKDARDVIFTFRP